MNWPQIRKQLRQKDPDQLIDLLKSLYDLSPGNKAFLRLQISDLPQDTEFLEKCRQQVIQAIYPPQRNYPDYPKFAQARKAVNEYNKTTKDINGTVDLLLTYAERGTAFTSDFGDIDDPFYQRLETALFNAIDLIKGARPEINSIAFFVHASFVCGKKLDGWDGVMEMLSTISLLNSRSWFQTHD